jgi:hypothetical protein
MIYVGTRFDGKILLQCPVCQFVIARSPKEPKKSKVQIEAEKKARFDGGYISKTTTNRLIVAVSRRKA